MELLARLAVLLACAGAAGGLYVLLARATGPGATGRTVSATGRTVSGAGRTASGTGRTATPAAPVPTPAAEPAAAPVPTPAAGPPPALLALSLGGFIVVAGGTALSGAGTVDPGGPLASAIRAAGVALLALAGVATALPLLRRRGVSGGARRGAASGVSAPTIVTLAWAGAALALLSWVVAAGALVVALVADARVERTG